MTGQQVAGAALVIGAAAGCWAFVVLYSAWYPWWRSEAGCHLFTFVACLGILDTLFALSVFFPDLPWLPFAMLAAFAPEPVIVWWRVSLLVRTRRRRGNESL